MLRRAVGVYQAIIRRLTAQTTDYRVLLSTFAEGLFTEMDFQNEALNALRMQARRAAGPRGVCCQGCAVSAPQCWAWAAMAAESVCRGSRVGYFFARMAARWCCMRTAAPACTRSERAGAGLCVLNK